MHMLKFQIGSCDLKMKKEALESFAYNNYLRFYKNEKFRHVTRNDKRLPKIKQTDDIFSLQIWFKDKSKTEHRIFIDGTVLLEHIKIHTITIDKYSFNEYEYEIFLEILKGISKNADGYILISTDSKPQRIVNGKIQNYETLLQEMFNNIPKNKQDEVSNLYNWMIQSDTDDIE